jgi:hypothetical protein
MLHVHSRVEDNMRSAKMGASIIAPFFQEENQMSLQLVNEARRKPGPSAPPRRRCAGAANML